MFSYALSFNIPFNLIVFIQSKCDSKNGFWLYNALTNNITRSKYAEIIYEIVQKIWVANYGTISSWCID